MYSMILLMSMTGTPEVIEFGGRRGCLGCSGCMGCWSSCYGCSSCSGCSGCSGCWGTWSYYAPSWSAGSCQGCYSSWSHSSCYGCLGSYSAGCSGVPRGTDVYWMAPLACYGYGMPQPAPRLTPPAVEEKGSDKKPMSLKPSFSPDRAAIWVQLPADARLWTDGQPTTLTGTSRQFLTPKLEVGKEYQYTLEVEYIRNAQPIRETKTIRFQAGDSKTIVFGDSAAREANTVVSRVEVKLPDGATLYVNDQPTNAAVKSFQTPPLPKGQEFTYLFRADVMREGKLKSQVQQVTFTAGEPITVEFDALDSTEAVRK